MKKGNTDKWKDIKSSNNLLFFSQLVNELLFDYSIPSNRISTLNSHYLCLDALSAIVGIDNKGVPEGTLKPIMEELYSEVKKDPVFAEGNKPTDYFVKTSSDEIKTCYRASEMNYSESKNTALALHDLFFNNNGYYECLKKKIIQIIKNNNEDDQQVLFRLTKSLLTELMNGGYSLKYLYMLMDRLFWNTRKTIGNWERIKEFFDAFDFQEKEYIVIFKVDHNRTAPLIDKIDGLEFLDNLPSKIETLASREFKEKKRGEDYLLVKRNAFDPYKAADRAIEMMEMNASVYRLYDHEFSYSIRMAQAEVFDKKTVYKVGRVLRAVEHTKKPSRSKIAEGLDLVNKAIESVADTRDFDKAFSVLSAIRYHSHSLDSQAEENQLLDLWAIFESVLDISNKHTSDRIQQICRYLVPILKHNYIYMLFKQLADDIKYYDEEFFSEMTCDLQSEQEIVKRICEFSILDERSEDRMAFFERASDFPLLKERISYYQFCLATPAKAHQFVEKHAERVRWQVRRIYRNRNLIIHNGESMPYLSLLIENLHSYVDDFLSYTIHALSKKKTIDSMCQELFVKECRWNAMFPKQKDPITPSQIEYMLSM